MNPIRAYYQINQQLASSGQPTEAQFVDIQQSGYQVVINLAMPTSDFALPNEREIVESLGMIYRPIPVPWEDPQVAHVQDFFAALNHYKNKKIWVHCALNMRASCFVYLYRKHVLGEAESEAQFPMSAIWQPTGVWQELIDRVKNAY